MGKLGDIEEAQNVAEQSGQLEFLDTAKPRSHYFWRRSRPVSQKSPCDVLCVECQTAAVRMFLRFFRLGVLAFDPQNLLHGRVHPYSG